MSETTAAAEAAQTTAAQAAQTTAEPEPPAAAEPAAEAAPASERPPGTAADAAESAGPDDPAFDPVRRATELAILDALRSVVDPELGLDVVELALIRQVLVGAESSEVKMVLTTPFCPYAGSMIQQIKDAAESVLQHPVKVTVLAERWDPRDAGLMW